MNLRILILNRIHLAVCTFANMMAYTYQTYYYDSFKSSTYIFKAFSNLDYIVQNSF